MKLSKKIMVAAAVGALGVASAVPAMALENEFHGMYRAYGFMTNASAVRKDTQVDKIWEQRARLQYIAKASDDLKLVTHFELDTRFGGQGTAGYKGIAGNNDAGNLDADTINLETKNVYLDFNIPSTKVNVKAGIQPLPDTLMYVYTLADAAGVNVTAKFDALTASYAYYTVGNSSAAATYTNNSVTADLNVLDLKFAINKDTSVGATYYMLLDKNNAYGSATLVNNTLGLNVATKVGPAALAAVAGYQFGRENKDLALNTNGTSAFAVAATAKIDAGPGKVNLAALYLSGNNDNGNYNFNKAWKPLAAAQSYFAPANMWLITSNINRINVNPVISGNDIAKNGLGLMGLFGGYEGTAGKVFYNANLGWAKVAKKQSADSGVIGTELNATIGYNLYTNLKASFTGAYAIVGDGLGKDSGTRLNSGTGANALVGVKDADNAFMGQLALNYAF